MASGSDSDIESQRSLSPSVQGPAPTPGYGLDRSPSNSPTTFRNRSPSTGRSRSGSRSGGSQRSNSVASEHSNKSRSQSPASNKSQRSQSAGSATSNRSGASNRSRSGSRSASPGSNKSRSRSGSRVSNRSGSRASNRSGSQASNHSGSRATSRSGSRASNRSGSRASNRSGSQASNRSGSHASNRSQSRASSRSGSRNSKTSNRSRSQESHRSRSSSRNSKASNRSGSGSQRSRSGSKESNRSRSAESNRSKSRSRSHSRGSKSPSQNRNASQDNSRSNSPNLEIDGGSPGSDVVSKRKRSTSQEGEAKKKHRLIDSESENEEQQEPSAAALFGDADDISSEEERDKGEDVERGSEGGRSDADARERLSDVDENERRPLIEEEEEKEPEPEPVPETRIDVEIPKISCDLGRDIHFVKLPNFLSVETRPFDQETYEDEIDEEETLDEEGRARLKLKVENTIRWREDVDKEGNTFKESNARFVRWSDGSLSLHLGSEIFDVYKQPLQGDHNHLFIRQGTGLQGQAVFRTKLSFRPHSTESFTHRKMTLSLADRSQKVSGIKILSQVGVDPDQDRKTLLKKEEEKLRQTVRITKTRKRGEGGTRSHARETFREEDGSDEEGVISLNAIKNKYKSGAAVAQTRGGGIYSSDEEGSDFEARRSRKLDKAKALKDSDSSESE
ncbi:hypothetical protein PPYR_08186 [Photinus pyralis]|uniref:RNA polymerase-associated protein LEO1 n=1 Tax=Photinus pyralis TaxID=7054 RepID=A0A1Y1MJP0_PHOPY|nr:another transcription unit protein-like [Photinus pyralis]XP_031344121.1 another transcription unit protein-like [Photinus pyralis]KAB0797192.1 hypothetical protein PPYR_08186 [Photinus pyralis]